MPDLRAGGGRRAGGGSSASAKDRPNILIILSDDHATNAIGCYGGRLASLNPTPRLDRLARQGVRLTRVFCTNPICTTSRASILTGQYSHRNGVYKLNDPLDPKQRHVGHALQAAGYTTAVIGKWHLTTNPRGFDHWQVLHRQGQYFNPVLFSADSKHRPRARSSRRSRSRRRHHRHLHIRPGLPARRT